MGKVILKLLIAVEILKTYFCDCVFRHVVWLLELFLCCMYAEADICVVAIITLVSAKITIVPITTCVYLSEIRLRTILGMIIT